MSKLDIRVYPDKILRKRAGEVKNIGKEEKALAKDMLEVMRSSNGVGLAAPQVGISKRIIVIEALTDDTLPLVLFNPRILEKKGRSSFCEGCLSVPDITSDVIRPEFIIVEAIDLKGEELRIDTGGLLARVIQHEVDHLDGVLFIDRIGFFKRKKVLKQISPKVCTRL